MRATRILMALAATVPLAGGDVVAQQPASELTGCVGQIRTLVYSPDGKTLVAGGTFPNPILWDAATGKESLQLNSRAGWAMAAAFAPDGKSFAWTNWSDGTLSLWDLAKQKERFRAERHDRDEVHHVAFAPDGKTLASVGYDATVRVWDTATGKQVRVLKGHTGSTLGVAFSPDGKTLASTGGDKVARLWDTATGKELHTCAGHTDVVTAVVFAPDSKSLYTGGHERMIRVWDVATGKEVQQWPTQRGWARTLSLSPDGRSLAAANKTGTAQVFEVATGKERRVFGADKHVAWAVAFSPDGRTLATGGDEGVARLWDLSGSVGRPQRPALKDAELAEFWQDLTGASVPRAYAAVWALVAYPAQSVPLLARRFQEKAPEAGAAQVAELIRSLEDDYTVRERASVALLRLGPVAAAAVTKALQAGPPSAEQKKRLQDLESELAASASVTDAVRRARVLEVLEIIGTAEAKKVRDEIVKTSTPH